MQKGCTQLKANTPAWHGEAPLLITHEAMNARVLRRHQVRFVRQQLAETVVRDAIAMLFDITFRATRFIAVSVVLAVTRG